MPIIDVKNLLGILNKNVKTPILQVEKKYYPLQCDHF